MLTYGLALAMAMDRLHWHKVAGIGLALAGVLFIVLPEASLPDPAMAGWVLFAMLASASFAIANVAAARTRPPQTASLAMAAAMSLAAAAFLLPAMVIDGSWWFFDSGLDTGAWAVIGLGAIFAMLFTLFFEIVRLAGPVFFSTVNYIGPLSGVVLAMVIFGETLSPWLWAALALMMAGLTLMNLRRRTTG
jgi:drug/metabolite transporter (DMT)-like permease